jgi:outer membrane protein TolC
MKKYYVCIFLFFLGVFAPLYAQMSLEDAIETALNQNLKLKLSKNRVTSAQNLAGLGQAGLLPSVSASASSDYGNNSTQIVFAGDQDPLNASNAQSLNLFTSLSATYTIFSGGSQINRFRKLQMDVDLSFLQNRLDIESTILSVVSAYSNVLRAKDNYQALCETMAFSLERVIIAKRKKEFSGANRTQLLNAEVDLNQDSVASVQALHEIEAAEISFNKLLNRDLTSEVSLTNLPFLFSGILDYSLLKQTMLRQNTDVLSARLNVQNSILSLKISKSSYLPRLNLTGSYNFVRSETEGNFLTLNQSKGLGILFSLSFPIYSGGTRKASLKNAQLDVMNNEWELKETFLSMEANLLNAFSEYENNQHIVLMEEKNILINQKNLEYAKRDFDAGILSSNEYRRAQINLLLVKNNLNNARYNFVLSEMEVLRLSGNLINRF